MNFADRLDHAVRETGNPCLVGIDPHLDLLPDEFAAARDPRVPRRERAEAVARFCTELVDVCAGRVAAVKPQSAFFEQLGADGVAALESVVRQAKQAGLLVIGDVKRGDISSTAAAYARGHLEGFSEDDREVLFDAITVNPYLGDDAMAPFVEACERAGTGLYVLVRTSNPGSARIQLHGDPPLFEAVADAVHEWGASVVGESGLSSVGAVVGATHPELLREMRARMPRTPFLLPGFGAQGAGAEDVLDAFLPGARGALVSSSRGVAFAHRSAANAGVPWKDAAAAALDVMIAQVSGALAARA